MAAQLLLRAWAVSNSCALVRIANGSFRQKVVYFRALTTAGTTLTVKYEADEPSRATLRTYTDGEVGEEQLDFLATTHDLTVSQSMPDVIEDTTDDVSVTLTRKHAREAAVTVRNGEFEVEVASRYLGHAERNGFKKRLDVKILPLKDVARSKVCMAARGLPGAVAAGLYSDSS